MTDEAPDDPKAKAAAARSKARTRKPGRPRTTGAICGADTAKGTPCKNGPGEGTEHPGVGPCKSHDTGWATARGDTRADQYARPLLAKLTGYDVDVNPLDALLMCVRIAAAEVAYFTERVAMLGEDALVMRPTITRSTVKDGGKGSIEKSVVKIEEQEELNLWLKARKASLRDLAHFSKMALDAGVEERMVRVQESVGESLAAAVRGILDDLDLTPGQKEGAPEIVRRHLRLLGSGTP